MTFQRTIIGLLILMLAGLAGAFYIDWRLAVQVRTMKAFVEGYVFAEAVAACEKAPSTTPFKWNERQEDRRDRIEFGQARQGYGRSRATRWSPTASIATTIRSRRRPTSARISSNGTERALVVIARSEATKQSKIDASRRKLDCFASLAMTVVQIPSAPRRHRVRPAIGATHRRCRSTNRSPESRARYRR